MLSGLLAALVSSGLNMGSSALSMVHSNYSQRKQYKYNLALQKDMQAWQERMSNTAHQREVQDLRAAGLNPILTATGGNGASFSNASGSSVSAPSADIDLGGNAIASAISSAAQVENAEAATMNAKANALGVQSQVLKNNQEIATSSALEFKHRADALKSLVEADDVKSGISTNRIFGNALKNINNFLNSDAFQNSASNLFLKQHEFHQKFGPYRSFVKQHHDLFDRRSVQSERIK